MSRQMAMEITSNIFQVGGDGFTSSQDAAVYLVRFEGQSVLIDSGCGFDVDRLLTTIQSTGVTVDQIQMVLITHCHFDHSGGALELKNRLGCDLVCHELDAVYLEQGDNDVTAASWYNATIQPFKPDRQLSQPRETLTIGDQKIVAIHIPGHSPGSVAYLMESDGKRVLFGQDVHGPLHPSLKSNAAEYQTSLKTLISLEADILCEGHYGVIRGRKAVTDFINSFV